MRGRPTPSGGGVPPNAQQGPRPASARSPAPSGSAALRFPRFLRGGRRPVSAGLGVALLATRVAWRAAAVGPQWPRSVPSAGGVGPRSSGHTGASGLQLTCGKVWRCPRRRFVRVHGPGPLRCVTSHPTTQQPWGTVSVGGSSDAA